MGRVRIPAELLAEFRNRSLERLGRIESSWYSVVSTQAADLGVEIERDVHTVKGDARLLGFHDISVLCHKLEDILRFSRSRGYEIPETIDLLVAPLLGLLRLLLHKRADQPMAGVDLVEFSRQVDVALREAYLEPQPARPSNQLARVTATHAAVAATGQINAGSIDELAVAATDVYLLSRRPDCASQRDALREIWSSIAREVRRTRTVPLTTVLSRHGAMVREMAQRMGKRLEFLMQVERATVGPTLVPVVEMMVSHAVTNAIDHGIESEQERRELGKEDNGRIEVQARVRGEQLELVIADNGRGVDLEAVRKRAVEVGVLRSESAAQASDSVLLELLMLPNFTTRHQASETSGRGVGLDAVRTAVSRHGGHIQVETEHGKGTRVIVQLPQQRQEIAVLHFSLGDQRLAIPSGWKASKGKAGPQTLDPMEKLGLLPEGPAEVVAEPAALDLTDGARTVSIVTSSTAIPAVAERLCPTGPNHPIEVVLLEEGEALLIRPDRLAES